MGERGFGEAASGGQNEKWTTRQTTGGGRYGANRLHFPTASIGMSPLMKMKGRVKPPHPTTALGLTRD